KVIFPENSLFIAIKGVRHDGHQYIRSLYHAGVREFIIESNALTDSLLKEVQDLQEGKAWVVTDAVRALQKIVQRKRSGISIPVTAITGSNGKTIVKEWLSQLLGPDMNVLASPKRYHPPVGAPLSLWPLNAAYQLAIFEAGISQPHAMEYLETVIRPDIGISTNIGTAHDEGFRRIKQKVAEKLR